MTVTWKQHKEKWLGCELCELCHKRKRVVLCRGDLPCELLFVGEAPGPSEDITGLPFDGPAGKKLDQIIAEARRSSGWAGTIALTNLVACIPLDEDDKKFGEPKKVHIDACHDRLMEIIAIARPRVIVRVGTLATKNLPMENGSYYRHSGIPMVDIIHPAAILRMPVAKRDFAIRKCIVTLANTMEGLNVSSN